MKYLFLVFGFVFFISISGIGQDSSRTQISLLTCGPDYSDPEAMFGHSAIRIYDPSRNFDRVFNYGIYDFSDPNFLVNFVKGNTQYIVAQYAYSDFLISYRRDQRWVKEQILNLDPIQKESIESFLINNIKPENQKYLYQFFYDNCSIRIKDLLELKLPEYDYANSPDQMLTYRQLINQYAIGMDWTDFGIDIIIGSPGDEIVDHHGQMFLPDYLMYYMDRFQSPNNQKLVLSTHDVLTIEKDRPTSFWITPIVLFAILLFVELILFIKRKEWASKWIGVYDILFYIVVSLASALLLLMLSTLHYPCHANYNLLWLSPLFIPFTLLRLVASNSKWQKLLSYAILGILTITFLGWSWWPQSLPSVGLLIIGILILKILRGMTSNISLQATP